MYLTIGIMICTSIWLLGKHLKWKEHFVDFGFLNFIADYVVLFGEFQVGWWLFWSNWILDKRSLWILFDPQGKLSFLGISTDVGISSSLNPYSKSAGAVQISFEFLEITVWFGAPFSYVHLTSELLRFVLHIYMRFLYCSQ